MTTPDTESPVRPDEPHEIPPERIQSAQDCIDLRTVEFDASTVVRQGAKRSILGECVVTGRQFEAVYLHSDPLVKDHDVGADEPMHHFTFDRVWQYQPEKVDVQLTDVPYGQLRDQSLSFGTPGTIVGSTRRHD